MKLSRIILAILLLMLFGTACSKKPGPLAAGNGRIKVQCTGFASGSYLIIVTQTDTGQQMGPSQDLGCLFSQAVYFDVPVPPKGYNVYADNALYDQVIFNGPGEEHVVRITAVIVQTSSSI